MQLDMFRSRVDLPDDIIETFAKAKEDSAYAAAFDDPEPLVSICVATYNRSELLVRRCLKSLIAQTYRKIEILVVGDHCTDGTHCAIEALGDSRVVFVNLPERGRYPADPSLRWMVAGTVPVNHALSLARGTFITHLDDDDEHAQDRVEKLLRFIQSSRVDLVFHPFEWESKQGRWVRNDAREFRYAQVTTSSIFYHRWLKSIPWDPDAYKYREPGDWNRFRKMLYIGATVRRYPEPLLKHYAERSQVGV
jgi:cellulose synthase/poly-beta-1,6-N-acetylglucosamine synthase-like glycosyltransferase